MPNPAKESSALDLLYTTLQGVGTPTTAWLTKPIVTVGIPTDAVDVRLAPVLLVHHHRSDIKGAEAGVTDHRVRATYHVYCCAALASGGEKLVLSLKADVLRAVFAAEGAFTSAFGFYMEPGDYSYRDDMHNAGIAVGIQELMIDLTLPHASP